MEELMEAWPTLWQEEWEKQGFHQASEIQQVTFKPLKEKQGVIGIAPTGSGKTLAYLWPLLLNVEKGQGNQLLILTSSQELAIQVTEVAKTWGGLLGLNVQPMIGGANIKRQQEKLKTKPEVLIGTPGRVLQLVKSRKIKSQQLETIVLDEADQLVGDQTNRMVADILNHTNKDYQLVFFSATADRALVEIEELVGSQLPVYDVSATDQSNQGLRHHFIMVPTRKREDVLRRLLHIDGFQGLFFFNQLQELDVMEQKLIFQGLPVASLASDQTKLMRKIAIDGFKSGKVSGLLATDVAARGLDIDQLPYVINVDIPTTPESYLHRAGRTARMGKEGHVITLIHEGNQSAYLKLMKNLDVTTEELFVYGGTLVTERPVKEETGSVKQQTKKVKGAKKKNKGAKRK